MRFLLSIVILLALTLVPGQTWADESQEVTEVGVDALVKSPEAYQGQIQVVGVVSQVASDVKMFGLIDLEEFKTCRKVTCASLFLPVKWEGTLPEVGQQVRAVGQIRKDGDRYLFKASKVDLEPGN